LRIYTKEEIKGYPKGITQTVYRDLKEGTEIENLNDFEFTDKVGIPVHTAANEHQAGKVRIYNPLDLRKKDIEDFTGSAFMEELIDDEILQNIIVKHSKLPKVEARERIKDLIAEYQFAVTELGKLSLGDEDRIEYALNIKVGKEAKDIINELGYDSILYNKEGQTAVMLFEPGQFRAIESSNPSKPVTEKQMDDLGFEREGYAEGGLFERRQYAFGDRIRKLRKKEPRIPTNIRQFLYDLAGGKGTLTEKHLQKDELTALENIVRENINKGRYNLVEPDYKTIAPESEYSDIGLIGKKSISNKEFIKKLRDPYFSLKTTLGKASIGIDNKGNVLVTDQYNFSEVGDASDADRRFIPDIRKAGSSLYLQARNIGRHFGSDVGEGSPVVINLGPLDDLKNNLTK